MLHLRIDIRNTPKYTHDCTACVFVGGLGQWDIYVCPHSSIIGRYGNDPHENCSGSAFVLGNEDWCPAHHDHYNQPISEISWSNAAAVVLAQHAVREIQNAENPHHN